MACTQYLILFRRAKTKAPTRLAGASSGGKTHKIPRCLRRIWEIALPQNAYKIRGMSADQPTLIVPLKTKP